MSFFYPVSVRCFCVSLVYVLFFCSVHLYAEDDDGLSLPEPLTLESVLQFADEPHPDLSEVRAALEYAEAERLRVESQLGINASVFGRLGHLRRVNALSVTNNSSDNDSSLSLYVSKRLYDFGRSSARFSAAEADIGAQKLLYIDARRKRRIDIMACFFDVLLADMEFDSSREATAVTYVRSDRLRDRNELGQVSDIDVLEAESEYRKARSKRAVSEARRRITRSLLSEALNRPGMLPATLVKPALPDNDRELPEVQELIREALDKNPALLALRSSIHAERERLKAARSEKNPILLAEAAIIEGSRYQREFGSSDRWRAHLTLEIPLSTGGRVTSLMASRTSELHRRETRLARNEMEVRKAIIETWEEINVLLIQRDEVRSLMEYRDLYLDRSRALHELEVNTDLGDSMTKYSEALFRIAQVNYELALAWARLDALTDKPAL